MGACQSFAGLFWEASTLRIGFLFKLAVLVNGGREAHAPSRQQAARAGRTHLSTEPGRSLRRVLMAWGSPTAAALLQSPQTQQTSHRETSVFPWPSAGDGVGQHLPDELWSLFSYTHRWFLLYFPCVFGIAGIREVSASNPEQIQPESHSEGFTLTHLISPSGGSQHPEHRGMPSTAGACKERAVLPMQEEGSCWKLG